MRYVLPNSVTLQPTKRNSQPFSYLPASPIVKAAVAIVAGLLLLLLLLLQLLLLCCLDLYSSLSQLSLDVLYEQVDSHHVLTSTRG